jgi:hypothetical protein
MKLFLSACLLFVSALAFSQSQKNDSTTGFLYWGFGYQYQSFGNLSNRIGSRPEFEKPGSSMANIFLGINKENSGFIRDFQVHFSASTKGDDEKRNTSILGGGAAFTVGYNFSKKANFRIYPFVGVSGETYYAKFNRDISSISFDSILVSNTVQQRTEPVSFTNMFFCYQGGIAVDFINTKYRFLRSIGLRASYTGSFKSRNWRVNDNQLIANAPSDRIGQFNGSLLFSFGAKRSNRMMF